MKFHFVLLTIFCHVLLINTLDCKSSLAVDCKSPKGSLANPGAPQGSINGFPDDAICNTGIYVHETTTHYCK